MPAKEKKKDSKAASVVEEKREHMYMSIIPDDSASNNKSIHAKRARAHVVKSGNAGTSSINSATDALPPSEKQMLFPGWTGKTPVVLLNEYCQKQAWNKPGFDVKQLGTMGFSAAVTLSRFNKKTLDTDRVRFALPRDLMRGTTAAEAKHFAAVYALHRFNHRTNMHMTLPPTMKDFWIHLESVRKSAGKNKEWMYFADPFAQIPPATPTEVDRQASKAEAMEAAASRYYDNAPTVRMSEENRRYIEQVIKEAGITLDEGEVDGDVLIPSSAKARLTRLGFRLAHVEEALRYTKSEQSALDWLCLYVPEDDLPTIFQPHNLNMTVRGEAHDTTSLATSWTVDRMAKIGYPRAACEEALKMFSGDEGSALEELQSNLLNRDSIIHPDIDPKEAQALREDELVALRAIFDDRYEQVDPQAITIRINSNRKDRRFYLTVRFLEGSLYPFVDPVLEIEPNLPAYIKLHCIKSLLCEIEQQQLRGSPMISLLVEWLDEHLDGLIDNPPELKATTEGLVELRLNSSLAPTISMREVSTPRRRKMRPTKDSKILLSELNALHSSDVYKPIQITREKLPASSFSHQVISIICSHDVVIVSGETGCGKTTQIPQFVLDDMIKNGHGAEANIIVTQPRRISALGVANRVAKERCEEIGGTVGYAIRGETRVTGNTKLLFCTTGVLLRRMQSDADLDGISHVIIDEVHERSVDTDVLLILMRKLVKRRKNFKVILMSATLSRSTFSDYFGGAPSVTIPGFTHPVKSYFLEDFLGTIDIAHRDTSQKRQDGVEEEYTDLGFGQGQMNTLRSIEHRGADFDMIAGVVKHILSVSSKGAILIFVSGVIEIKRSIEAIVDSCGKYDIDVLPLHAGLTPHEQNRIFDALTKRKIIVSTNVAETSITIDDVVYVVDTGRVKETRFDATSNLVSLTETWAAQASIRQRRGRAGRTGPGECYHLYTRRVERRMAAQQVPEMLRLPMEQLSLQVKAMQQEKESVANFLSQSLSPPSMMGLEKAWTTLEQMNAVEASGQLTALGRQMAMIPADLRIAKMLIYGAMFSCLDKVLSVAAVMSSRSLFNSPIDKREEAKRARQRYYSSNSDLLTDVAAFEAWVDLRESKNSRFQIDQFCRENHLSSTALHEVVSLRRQYLDALVEIGLVDTTANHSHHSKHCANDNLIKAIIMAGLYPNIAKVKLPQTKFDKSISGTVEREHESRQVRFFLKEEGRAFLHPSSMLFSQSSYPTTFISYFSKMATAKLFIREITEVPLYGLLLFGGHVRVDHLGKGLVIGDDWIRLKAWARIGVLVNQLRKLLDGLLEAKMQNSNIEMDSSPVVQAMLNLLHRDGL